MEMSFQATDTCRLFIIAFKLSRAIDTSSHVEAC